MKRYKRHYIESFGGVWRLSQSAYVRMLKDIKEGKDIDLDDYGLQVVDDQIQSLTVIQNNHRNGD